MKNKQKAPYEEMNIPADIKSAFYSRPFLCINSYEVFKDQCFLLLLSFYSPQPLTDIASSHFHTVDLLEDNTEL